MVSGYLGFLFIFACNYFCEELCIWFAKSARLQALLARLLPAGRRRDNFKEPLQAASRILDHPQPQCLRKRPPGLIRHVLTVLVFLFWVLLLPRPPPSSRSLRLCPWTSILLHGPLDICLDLLPAAPPPPVQKRDAQHMVLQHRGAHGECQTSSPSF